MVIIDGYQVATNKISTNNNTTTNNNDTMITVPPKPYREFEANVIILHHQTTIGCGYEPVIHCGVLRQAAEMIHIQGHETMKTGERAIVRFRFLYFAEYVLPGSTFIFREGRAKGIGKILKVFPV